MEEDNSDYVEDAEGEDGEGEGEDEDDIDSDDDEAAAPPAANNRAPEEAAEGTQVFMTNIQNRFLTVFLMIHRRVTCSGQEKKARRLSESLKQSQPSKTFKQKTADNEKLNQHDAFFKSKVVSPFSYPRFTQKD